MPSLSAPSLTAEELDELIYVARVGDLDALKTTISEISSSHSSPADTIIEAAIDRETDESGSSSSCCLLHWPAANGNEDVLSYLLSLLGPKQDLPGGPVKTTSRLVNHKNKSGNTPLHWAAVNGHVLCVKALVAAGGDPATTNDAGHDALYEADCSGKDGGREVAEWILANCAGLESWMSEKDAGAEIAADDVVESDEVMVDETNNT